MKMVADKAVQEGGVDVQANIFCQSERELCSCSDAQVKKLTFFFTRLKSFLYLNRALHAPNQTFNKTTKCQKSWFSCVWLIFLH